jgi:hypothetical protein
LIIFPAEGRGKMQIKAKKANYVNKAILVVFVGIAILLIGCSDTELSEINGSTVIVDGKTYAVGLKEVTPDETTAAKPTEIVPPKTPEKTAEHISSIRPPITKYLITTSNNPVGYVNGEVYLTDSYSRGDTIRITEYWIKENSYWTFRNENKDFPLNIRIEFYPSGGEFGEEQPGNNFKWYLMMPDGVEYMTNNAIFTISSEIIRISDYYIREKSGGRWYYQTGTKDLPKNVTRIEQLKM